MIIFVTHKYYLVHAKHLHSISKKTKLKDQNYKRVHSTIVYNTSVRKSNEMFGYKSTNCCTLDNIEVNRVMDP